MPGRAFEFVALPHARSVEKPRRTGLTMMIDWGLGIARQRDLLALAGDYIDLVKIATGTSRLYDEQVLRDKLGIYVLSHVRPLLGGQFQEYVYGTYGPDSLPEFFREARRVGFELVEISDSGVPLSAEERRRQIYLAQDFGLSVVAEVGSKTVAHGSEELIAQGKVCLDAEVEMLVIEGAELVRQGEPNAPLLNALRSSFGIGDVIFELPGPWVSHTAHSDVYDLKKWLIAEFGPDVNLANIMPDDILETEALRVGLSVMGPRPAVREAEVGSSGV